MKTQLKGNYPNAKVTLYMFPIVIHSNNCDKINAFLGKTILFNEIIRNMTSNGFVFK